MHRVFLGLAKVGISLLDQALVLENTLFLSVKESLLLHDGLKVGKGSEDLGDRVRNTLECNILVAVRAAHEFEGDAKGCPLALEHVNHTACVVHVSAAEF